MAYYNKAKLPRDCRGAFVHIIGRRLPQYKTSKSI
jgi:hypothetical protein